MGGVVESIGDAVGDVVGGVGDVVGDVVSGVGDVLDGAVEIVSDAGSSIDDFVNEEIPGGWGTVAAVAGGAALASGAIGGGTAAAGTGAGTAGGIATGTGATIFPVAAPGAIVSTPIAAGTVGIPAAAGLGGALVGAGTPIAGPATNLGGSLIGGLEGATATYAPGSLQAALPELGVNIAGGATSVPGSLGATLAELGVAPLTAGGAATAAANLNTGISLTDALRAANTVSNVLGGTEQPTTGTTGGGIMDVLGQVGQGVSGLLSSFAPSQTATAIGGALLEGLSTQDIINRLQDLGSTSQQQYQNLAQQATEGVQFTPYGVTTSLFGTTPTERGITSTLTGQGQQLSDAALQAALSSYQQAGTADLNQMAQERVGLYQQLVGPEQERQRLAAEARLAAQGRLGIGAGGGEYAPELRALQDAIARQNLQFAIQAPQEALAQRSALLQQGAGAAAIPTALAGQQLQAGQLSGTLGQQAASAAAQRGQLLGTISGQGISENLLANIAAGQVAAERNKALATALQGALGTGQTQQQSQQMSTANYLGGLGTTGGIGGLLSSPGFGGNLLSDINTVNQGIQAGQAIYNAGSGLFGSLGDLFV
jgi:hypothetical protein